MADLSQYGTVSSAPPDLSAYGVISGGVAKDDGSGSLKGFIQNSPIGAVKGIADVIRDPSKLSDMAHQNAALLDKAKEAYHKGDYTGALFHALNYFLPGGTALDDAGEDFQNGHVARGTAKTLGLASTMVAGAKVPAILNSATDVSAPSANSAAATFVKKLAVKAAARTTGIPVGTIHAVLDALTPEAEAAIVPKKSTISIPALRNRPPLRVPDTEQAPAPDATAIASELPSGRKPGGIANQTPLEPGKPPVAAANTAITEFAKKIGFDDFASQPGDAQKTILELFKASQEAPRARPFVPAPKSETSPAVPSPAVEPAAGVVPEVAAPAAEPVSKYEQYQKMLSDDHQNIVSLREQTAEPKTELEDLLERSLNGEKVAEQAKAELNDHLKMEALKKTANIVDRNQTRRALELGKLIKDYGIAPEHVESIGPEGWQKLADAATALRREVDPHADAFSPPSETTIQKVKDLLKMGQDQ